MDFIINKKKKTIYFYVVEAERLEPIIKKTKIDFRYVSSVVFSEGTLNVANKIS